MNGNESGDVDVGIAQIILNCLLWHPEGSSDSHCRELAMVNEAIDRHLGNSHQRCDLGHSKETDLAQRTVSACRHFPPNFLLRSRTSTPVTHDLQRETAI